MPQDLGQYKGHPINGFVDCDKSGFLFDVLRLLKIWYSYRRNDSYETELLHSVMEDLNIFCFHLIREWDEVSMSRQGRKFMDAPGCDKRGYLLTHLACRVLVSWMINPAQIKHLLASDAHQGLEKNRYTLVDYLDEGIMWRLWLQSNDNQFEVRLPLLDVQNFLADVLPFGETT